MSHAVMLVGGLATVGMACATWRAVDTAIRHNAEVMAAQQDQTQQLVESIRTLADQAGMLTSADLCPIRFRLRSRDGYLVPALRPMAALEREINGEFTDLSSILATTGGNINFGLNPPGRYRLTIRMDDGMHLQHEFDVLPGVPLDRLIVCPNRSANAGKLWLDVDWPRQLDRHRMLAVCCIEPMPFTRGDWMWQPSPRWDVVYGLVGSSEQEFAAADQFLLAQRIELPDDPENGLQPATGMNVRFRYCRLKQVTFLGRFGEGRELTALGTVVFESGPLESASVNATTWYCNAPAPTFEIKGIEGHWLVQMPDDVVDELLQRIQDLTSAQGTAGSGRGHGVL
jgi:hypothetical protein